MFTLYTTPLSANGRKALAVCHHLGLKPAVEIVNVYEGEGQTPEYLAIHPLGKIPTLVDGDLTLSESNAILLYLAEAYGDCRLWSREPKRRADIARWLFWESAHWQPTLIALPGLANVVAGLLGRPLGGGVPAEASWTDPSFAPLVRFLDEHLRRHTFLAGDELTLADFSVAAMMMYARPARFPFGSFPSIRAWHARIEALEAWKATAAGPWRY
jgi:glutathione S-transferase